jgi:hypothetical protein
MPNGNLRAFRPAATFPHVLYVTIFVTADLGQVPRCVTCEELFECARVYGARGEREYSPEAQKSVTNFEALLSVRSILARPCARNLRLTFGCRFTSKSR